MKLYAEHPARRAAQVAADLLAAAILGLAVWAATAVHREVLRLRAPGDQLAAAGSGLSDTFGSAADSVGTLPVVGGVLADALHDASGAGRQLSEVGQWQAGSMDTLALWLAVALVAVPVVVLLCTWLPSRRRFVRTASDAARLRALGVPGYEVLALRALVSQAHPRVPLPDGAVAGWRARDPAVITALADAELIRLGLRPASAVRR